MTRKGSHDDRRLLVSSPAPRMDVARGFAVTGDAEELLRRFAEEPHTEPVPLGAHAESVRVLRWRLDPAVAEVSTPDVFELEGSAARTPAGSYLVDARREDVLLRFRERGRRLELSFRRGEVSLFALGLQPDDLPAFDPRVAFEGGPLPEWLTDHIDRLVTHEGAVGAVASPGALARFAGQHPADRVAAGPPVAVRGARAWARSVDEDQWGALEEMAATRARELGEQLTEADALRIALDRDLLECVKVTMRLAARGVTLVAALRELDARAERMLSRLTEETPTTDDPVLRAVAWGEPEAWWGALAR